MSVSRRVLEEFVAGLAADHRRWSESISHSPEARSYAPIWEDAQVNAWLICWSVGHDTGWHDHDDAAAAIQVISGAIHEERLRLAQPPATRLLTPGATFFVPPDAIHRVRHAQGAPAISIHAYSPPLRRTGAYSVDAHGALQRTAQASEQELRPAVPAA